MNGRAERKSLMETTYEYSKTKIIRFYISRRREEKKTMENGALALTHNQKINKPKLYWRKELIEYREERLQPFRNEISK